MWRRERNRTPFHVTDVENLYSALRDGNNATAVRYAARIIDRGLNGPPEGIDERRTVTLHAMGESETKKFSEMADKLEQMVGRQFRMGAPVPAPDAEDDGKEDAKGKEAAKGAGAKGAKAKAGDAKNPPDEFSKPDHRKPGDDEAPGDQSPAFTVPQANLWATESGAQGAIPWEAITQLVVLVIQILRNWQTG